jgi:DNA-binding XRE family transcriptional regulator
MKPDDAALVWILDADAVRVASADARPFIVRPAAALRDWIAVTAWPEGRRRPDGLPRGAMSGTSSWQCIPNSSGGTDDPARLPPERAGACRERALGSAVPRSRPPASSARLTEYIRRHIILDMRGAAFGRRLVTLREARGLTQLALARRARVPQSYLSRLEAGIQRNPGLAIARKLAKALGVSVAALVE